MSSVPPPSKKLHRFFIDTLPTAAAFQLEDTALVHQITRVLALGNGESFILFSNGTDDVVVEITSTNRGAVQVRVVRTIPQLPAPRCTLSAAISIPKRDVFETIVQKLTELGVTEIIPLRSDRTIKQSVRLDRLQTISDEALEQCGGNRRVVIHEPMDLAACLAQYAAYSAILYDAAGIPRTDAHTTAISCIMYVGPEGGWSEHDRAQFAAAGVTPVTLGPRILRTDTAAIVGAATLL